MISFFPHSRLILYQVRRDLDQAVGLSRLPMPGQQVPAPAENEVLSGEYRRSK
jgi:hypothetical protein